MAEYGEWNRKGATLSDVTAHKEYGVSRDFIVKGIRAGKLEYREGRYMGQPLFASFEEPTRAIHRQTAWLKPVGEHQDPDGVA